VAKSTIRLLQPASGGTALRFDLPKAPRFSSGVTLACGQRSRTVSTRESTTQNDDWKRIGFGWDERRILVGHGIIFL
jgi:hypothetical protein